MMSVVPFPPAKPYNPLDDMEELLDSSQYDYERQTHSRLSFLCESRETCYTLYLEWHEEYQAVRCSVVLLDESSINLSDEMIEKAIETANHTAWHGFFMQDGVGNIVFKALTKIRIDSHLQAIEMMEDVIDRSIEEMDRLYVSLSLSRDGVGQADTLFPDDQDYRIENLALMFSEPKGNA